MNFNEYQEKAQITATYPTTLKIIYPSLGLAGESGEVCEKIKKVYRDKNGVFTADVISEIKKELGDVLWYVQAIAHDLGIKMDDIAEENIKKLYSRKERSVIHGNGDNR